MDTKVYQITDGPNRDKLIDAFKYAFDRDAELTLSFKFRESKDSHDLLNVKNFRIVSLKHTAENGTNFRIEGYCYCAFEGEKMVRAKFMAHYDAANRWGTIEFS